ncbi:MAG: 50S ribosomal protein L13 [Candidatus Margulisiibacteriota bacterium]|nr:MAG: 50S ribosomal protein L13 [Candidatus Margulisbacteria bacterium GWD2_39_127]OGI04617.1 MAG: 50S ribosomal protein L13 [Candidatus Margulisbacteria bacterium GWF2_38_17]OGI11851.1 MAG: 50S ribosomal protein L13 [Candidatus Margulisbacteria bacterium GWE2_39_32]PZM79774.1 MAG: 50S ribosomal protein L13 [Candidatus Margulisiibacteriota bacterium]HAR62679.1 50S ribosomal protein L13 [Candidatus Margulisiibacteriota bacterium]
MRNTKTFSAKPDSVDKKWYLVDAKGKTLGRLASQVATILRGKNKPEFTPSMDTGDYVVVINAEKISVTGRKETDKMYHRYTGYAGGIKTESLITMRKKHPENILMIAVKGMLPKSPIGSKMLKKLKVCAGENHCYTAQKPQMIEL